MLYGRLSWFVWLHIQILCISYHTATAASSVTEAQTFSADLLKTVVRGWKIGPVVSKSGTGHRRLSAQRSCRNNLRWRHGRHALDNPLSSALVLSSISTSTPPATLTISLGQFPRIVDSQSSQTGYPHYIRSLADPTSVNLLQHYVPMQSCLWVRPTVDCRQYGRHMSINRILRQPAITGRQCSQLAKDYRDYSTR